MKEYYISVTSYHLGQLGSHFFGRQNNDYVEMSFHHLVTVYLIVGSYCMNGWESGAVVSFLHDAADIPAKFTKFFSQTQYKKMTIFCFLFMLIAWAWCRNIMLPVTIYHNYYQAKFEKEHISVSIFVYYLVCLVALHYWWMFVFLKMLRDLVFKGATED